MDLSSSADRYHRHFFRKIKIYQTSSVFSISGIPKYTFVERRTLSSQIDKYLGHQDGVLLFLGYSKSGKTVFRKKYFENSQFKTVIFRSKINSKVQDLYDEIASFFKVTTTSEIKSSSNLGSIYGFEGGWLNKKLGKLIGKKESKRESSY